MRRPPIPTDAILAHEHLVERVIARVFPDPTKPPKPTKKTTTKRARTLAPKTRV